MAAVNKTQKMGSLSSPQQLGASTKSSPLSDRTNTLKTNNAGTPNGIKSSLGKSMTNVARVGSGRLITNSRDHDGKENRIPREVRSNVAGSNPSIDVDFSGPRGDSSETAKCLEPRVSEAKTICDVFVPSAITSTPNCEAAAKDATPKISKLNPSLLPFTSKLSANNTLTKKGGFQVEETGRAANFQKNDQYVPEESYENNNLTSPIVDENNVSLFGLPWLPDCTYNYSVPPPALPNQAQQYFDQFELQSPYPFGGGALSLNSPGGIGVPPPSFHNQLQYQPAAPLGHPLLTPTSIQGENDGILATAEMEGYVSLRLKYNVAVDIATNKAIRIRDGSSLSVLSVSADGHQMALVHPKGRVLQYGSRIEIQCQDDISTKNAKMYPKGISFTADNCALVYLVDDGGARTTSDMFHDLYEANISDTLFREACKQNPFDAFHLCQLDLDKADYWRNELNEDCWQFGQTYVVQKSDGLTTVERRDTSDFIVLKASPSTGKIRLVNRFACITASLGPESHIFVKALERRMHYNGQTCVFTVRNAGHAAGFDEQGHLRLF